MSFNFFLLIFILFVLLPDLLNRYYYSKSSSGFTCPNIREILNLLYGKLPRYTYSAELAFIISLSLTYFAVKSELSFASYLPLVTFGYIAHLNSKELFDTPSNSFITILSFFILYSFFVKALEFVFIESNWDVVFKNRRFICWQ